MKKLLFTLLFLTLGTAWGGAYEDGLAAYQRNDYATAIKLWRPQAEQGDASAQYNLGLMYANGHGAAQDYKEAFKWWRLAAEQGNTKAQTFLSNLLARSLGNLSGGELARVTQAEHAANLESCLDGRYPSLCRHGDLSGGELARVTQAEHAENLESCLDGRYPSLCRH